MKQLEKIYNEPSVKIFFLIAISWIITCCGGLPLGGNEKNRWNISNQNLSGAHSADGWGSSIPVSVYISQQIINENPNLATQIQSAMQTWEYAVGKQLFNFNASMTTPLTGANFPNLYAPLNQPFNGLYFDFNWVANTGKNSSVLATTIWANNPYNPELIVKASIRFDHSYYVFGDALSQRNQGNLTLVDMESLALHEIGHFIGLIHTQDSDPTQPLYDPYSVMLPSMFIGPGNIKRDLSRGDVNRIRMIYPGGDLTQVNNLVLAD